jgi:RsiW-degrading membrane proteinase PrsW (M82 family)
MFGLLVNMALLTIWVLLLYLFKRRLTIILLGVAVGIVPVSLLSILVELCLLKIPLTIQVSSIVVAPIVEETSKFLFIFLSAWKSRTILSEVRIFGAAEGVGFAYFENLGFITNVMDVLLRSFSSWPLHVIEALILSYSVQNTLTTKRNIILTVGYFLIAIIIHALFNMILFWI